MRVARPFANAGIAALLLAARRNRLPPPAPPSRPARRSARSSSGSSPTASLASTARQSARGSRTSVREDGFGAAQPGRGRAVASLSPTSASSPTSSSPTRRARPGSSSSTRSARPVEAAYRPWEALEPLIDDAMIRQIDSFAAAAPVAAGDGTRPRDGLRDRHRRLGRQPAAERDRVGADPARGRHARSRTAASTRPATRTRSARRSASPGAARGRRLHRRPGLQRLRRGPRPRTSTTPTNRAGASAGWPAVPGPDGPRRSSRSRPPGSTCRATSPSATTTGSCRATGRQRRLRADRDRLPQADGHGAPSPALSGALAGAHPGQPARRC